MTNIDLVAGCDIHPVNDTCRFVSAYNWERIGWSMTNVDLVAGCDIHLVNDTRRFVSAYNWERIWWSMTHVDLVNDRCRSVCWV